MSDFKPRPGTFLPYMEAARREKLFEPRAKASPLTLLEILARRDEQSLPMFDLQTQSGMEPSRYAEALKSLRDAGYISIDGEAPEQVIHLTASGAQVVRIAQPA
jgi:DNA-binding IclR family transcriptional regulator